MKGGIDMKRRRIMYMIVLISLLIGCNHVKKQDVEEVIQKETKIQIADPCTKPDGSKFRIAYIDYDPYEVASIQLYYVLEGLREMGWITCGRLPFSETEDAKKMMQMVSNMDLGNYIEVESEAIYYIIENDSNQSIQKSLTKHMKEKKIDLIIANGTEAGKFIKNEIELTVPAVVIGCTDPVNSEIIDSSTDGSGNDFIWAHVEPSVALRQLKYYYRLQKFTKLGMIVNGSEEISDVKSCMQAAEETGFEIIKYNISDNVSVASEKKEKEKHQEQVIHDAKQLIEDGIDAYLLTPNLIVDDSEDSIYRKELFEIFYENKIPILGMDRAEDVKYGALMAIIMADYENIGDFVSNTIGKILNGEIAGDLSCIYASSPTIYLNLNAAKQIEFTPSFKFLMSCDVIYSNTKEEVEEDGKKKE